MKRPVQITRRACNNPTPTRHPVSTSSVTSVEASSAHIRVISYPAGKTCLVRRILLLPPKLRATRKRDSPDPVCLFHSFHFQGHVLVTELDYLLNVKREI